jgi:hypothetical protein
MVMAPTGGQFPKDAIELTVPDAASASTLIAARRPDLFPVMHETARAYVEHFGVGRQPMLKRTLDALALAMARMGMRHGSWGKDQHQYHNEGHVLELMVGRLSRIRMERGWVALDAEDWLLLALFSACHDLRQRETPDPTREIGTNEQASIAEAFRILDVCGFDRANDQDFYSTLGYMIAGSTFDARPLPYNTAEVVSAGGCLAPKLVHDLAIGSAEFTSDEALHRCTKLMLIAADLDTANVAEPFPSFTSSSARLACEREMRAGRSMQAPESATPVFEFLTDGQERYFFKLHRFVSDIGREVFGAGKTINAPKIKVLCEEMRVKFGGRLKPGTTGQSLVDEFLNLAQAHH